ncbi:MAG: flagellar basal body P-ring formation protein FlgA [Verrucomicrobiales bacterium]|nr:flagellar basal body P-ring formation protein FlgA [Verrucomicrobiales bacterium]
MPRRLHLLSPALGRRLLLAWGAAVLLVPFVARGSDGTPVLSLNANAEVGRDGIYLDQVLALQPPTALPRVRIAPAPAIGQIAALSRDQVTTALRASAPDLVSTNWSGPDRVRVSRRSRMLDEAGVCELLRDHLQAEHVRGRGELELRLTRPWAPVAVPDEPLKVRIIESPATGPGANFIVRFDLLDGEDRVGNWQVVASAKIWREVPVAVTALRRGQVLADLTLGSERRDVLALRDAPAVVDPADTTLELIENVPAGQPLLARSLRPRPVIQRGQVVEALVRDGSMTISLKVEALTDALPGQAVRVRNPKTRRELMAKAINEETVLVPR